MAKPMTAADHFLAGEKLLAKAQTYHNSEKVTGWAAQAHAHFAAARLLLDADAMRYENDANQVVRNNGLDGIVIARQAN